MGFEDRYIYFPTREGDWDLPHSAPFPIEEVTFWAEDGVRLHAWYARPEGAAGTVLWCHGNAGNISDRFSAVVDFVQSLGVNVFIFDYRGYGRSEGKPDEAGLYADGRAAYGLLRERGVDPTTLVLMGRSLGAAVAIELATRADAAGLIVQSAFTSVRDMASATLPFHPLRWFVRTRFDNLTKIPRVRMPILLVHGTADEVVPFEMGRHLFEAAPPPKECLWLEGGDHNTFTQTHRAEWLAALRAFLREGATPGV